MAEIVNAAGDLYEINITEKLIIRGYYDTVEDLKAAHPTGELGDCYKVGDNLYVWSENDEWAGIGRLAGDVPDATETVKGIARIATESEALAGIDDTTIMTPAKVHRVFKRLTTIDIADGLTSSDWDGITVIWEGGNSGTWGDITDIVSGQDSAFFSPEKVNLINLNVTATCSVSNISAVNENGEIVITVDV